MNKDDAIVEIKDQLGEARLTNNYPTKSLTKKFQSTLSAIREEEKLFNNLFFEMYASNASPLQMYGMLKAHKPKQNYPMRLVA